MSCVASFHSGFEACFVCDIVCKWSRFSLWPRSPVASNKVLFVVSSARGRTLPSGAASGGFWDVTGKLLVTSGLPRVCLGVLRGRLGEAFGSFGGVLGGFWELLEPLVPPLGTSGAPQRGSWETHPNMLLGMPWPETKVCPVGAPPPAAPQDDPDGPNDETYRTKRT